MPKRFTETDKWSDPWFRKLPPTYKCFWDFICAKCNHAGIWNVDFEQAEFFIGDKLDLPTLKTLFDGRIMMGNALGNAYWWIPKFMAFQYGEKLNYGDAVTSAVRLIESRGFGEIAERILGEPYKAVRRGSPEGPQTLPPGSKAKAIAISLDVDVTTTTANSKINDTHFESIWKRYPKKTDKSIALRHFKRTVKTETDFKKIHLALDNYLAYLKQNGTELAFTKSAATWFNHWQDSLEDANGSDDSSSNTSLADDFKRAREDKKSREQATSGKVSTSV